MAKLISAFILIITISFISQAESAEKLDKKVIDQMKTVLQLNEELHQAFFKNDNNLMEKKVSEISQAITSLSSKVIKDKLEKSRQQLIQIKTGRAQEENNQAYHQFSMALGHIVRNYEISKDYALYSCPMVKKKWLQNIKNNSMVQNPYAASMPGCGEKEEDL